MTALPDFPLAHAGDSLLGRIALPEGTGPAPAVLVMSNAHGIGAQAPRAARALAALGYVAVVTDMYGGGALYPDPASAGEPFMAVFSNPALIRARAVAWFEATAAHPRVDAGRIAAIGYCFGGRCVLELARSAVPVRAVASYHGLLTTPDPAAPGSIAGEVAAWCGGRDPYAPEADIAAFRAEMAAAGARLQLTTFSHTGHGFTDPESDRAGLAGVAHDPLAEAVAWAGTLALLEAVLRA